MLTLEPGSLCDVCMEDFDPRKLPHCIPCGHVLCLTCCNNILDNITHLAPVCPFCREQFSRDTVRLVRIDFNCVSSPAQVHQKKKADSSGGHGTSSPGMRVKAYLFGYNVLSAVGWTHVLYRTFAHLSLMSGPAPSSSSFFAFLKKSSSLPPAWVPSIVPPHLVPLYQRACTAFDAVGSTAAFMQSTTALELLHARFGLVRSPLTTTAVQVASRLFSVWCIAARFHSAQRSPFYASMVLSWAPTGVIRHTSYAAKLVGWEFAPPLWARYSTFFVLYPIGAGSEALVNLATLPISVWFSVLPFAQWDAYALLRGASFIAWPGLYPLYAHIIK